MKRLFAWPTCGRQIWTGIWIALVSGAPIACKDLTEKSALPSNIIDPKEYQTAEGANKLALRARAEFQGAYSAAAVFSGLLSDELSWISVPYRVSVEGQDFGFQSVDRRSIPELRDEDIAYIDGVYGKINEARAYVINAISALRRYDPAVSPALIGELFAMQGFLEIVLADNFCSGIPLSTITFEGDYTYAPGSTTTQVYTHADLLLDSAMTFAADDSLISTWARIGKGRIRLALGKYSELPGLVDGIDTSYRYQFRTRFFVVTTYDDSEFAQVTVSDREGGNGFPYISSGDVRTAIYVATPSQNDRSVVRNLPLKYRNHENTPVPFIIASGIEAKLMLAEASLMNGNSGQWITSLNILRGTIGAGALSDPGDSLARIRMQLNERAAWLFLTGHRQGDLRRIVRNHRVPESVLYPTGVYQNTFLPYGEHINVSIPGSERHNPYFNGCLDRNA